VELLTQLGDMLLTVTTRQHFANQLHKSSKLKAMTNKKLCCLYGRRTDRWTWRCVY